ncbi:MAG: N-acetyltransferase [Phycisphaerales bacterium]|nr:N-acetyltransferase [Phycisphaerales bacterium]
MQIRPTQTDDVPSITSLLNHEIIHGVAHFGTEPIEQSEVKGQLAQAEGWFPWYCAFDDNDAFLGFCKSAPWSPRGGYNWTAEITIYLMPEARGRGIGKALYTKLLSTLSAQRFQVIVAGVSEPNPASVALHTSIGMKQTGYNTRMGYKHGQWIDVSYYQMILGEQPNPPEPILSIREAVGE